MEENEKVRRVRVLRGDARREAKKKGFDPSDLVVVRKTFPDDQIMPRYEVEKIEECEEEDEK